MNIFKKLRKLIDILKYFKKSETKGKKSKIMNMEVINY